MKDRLLERKSTTTRRSFLGQLAAAAAALTGPRLMWGAIRRRRPGSATGEARKATTWSLKSGPLLTRWASLVDPQAPHPDYPRPQLVRSEWLNLNGVWEYEPGTSADQAPPFGKSLAGAILVPYPVESALSGVMEHHDRLWYRRSLTIPAAWRGKRIMLHFGAVDYESEVFVNGQRVGLHRGGYDPFSYDITQFLKGGDNHELIMRVFDPTEAGGQPRGKQNTRPRGITYTPTTGIWQTVWLEPVDPSFITGLTMVPDIDQARLNLTVMTANPQGNHVVEIKVRSEGKVVTTLSAASDKEIAVPVPSSRLWSPKDPFLYTLELTVKHGNRVVDTVESYFGMRKIHVGDVNGEKKLLLNNEFVFQLGPLDQGFWPDGIYTPPTDEAMKTDILQMKAMGFNMVRKHIKVEPARWYYWTDKLGLLVWQDMPSANSYPGRAFVPPPVDKGAFENELKRMIEIHKNAPSIVLWTIFNENQGQFDTERLVNLVRSLDQSRPVNEASGGMIMGFGDLNDIHSYPEPAVRPSNGRQAMVCGEFGGIGYLIANHSWEKAGRGYVEVDTVPDLLYLYAEFIDWVHKLRDRNNLSAAVYTQLTDVMTEVNGLMTYDRVAKVPPEQLRLVNTFHFPAPTYTDIVPTSEASGQVWKFVFDRPDGQWSNIDYDDSQWSQGAGAFGKNGDHVGTQWNTPDLWLRRHFNPGTLTPAQLQDLVIVEFHEGNVEVFINGVQTYSQRGRNRAYEGRYEHRPIGQSVRKAVLLNADNVIAVHCHGDGNNQYFDAGLSIRIPSPLQPPLASASV
jgi:Glycosyl hydrolases family 2, sugar binding domain/Glycosyl hydrolases family 2/Glycosyl hydrolases family 2, TIM barrel domain